MALSKVKLAACIFVVVAVKILLFQLYCLLVNRTNRRNKKYRPISVVIYSKCTNRSM